MITYPDIEAIVVEYLADHFAQAHVATKRAQPGSSETLQIVVNGGYAQTLDDVRRIASVVIDVLHEDSVTATDMALQVESVIRDIKGQVIKRVDVTLGPVRLAEEGPFEKRSMSVDFVVKGSDI